ALCGIVGLKTTVGRVSRAGVYPLSHSLDSVGPLARSVEDAALVYQHLQGQDAGDETTLGIAPHDALRGLKSGVKDLRLAFAETVFFEGVEPALAQAVREAGRVLADLGARVSSMDLPEAQRALELNPRGLVVAAEAYAVNREYLEQHFADLDPAVRERMAQGKLIPAPDYFASTRQWAALRLQVLERLRDVDALLVPTTMIPALPVAEIDASPEVYARRNVQYLRNTSIGNILKLCGLSLPCGFNAQGLPMGLMIYGKPFQEDVVLRIGHAYEQATDWHRRAPDLSFAQGNALDQGRR
ncbi:MAG TPA: amidase, partial [bacterium]|nr:amidase [bacterium]